MIFEKVKGFLLLSGFIRWKQSNSVFDYFVGLALKELIYSFFMQSFDHYHSMSG